MKRILLINPKVREWAQPNCFPLGLGYIATVCRDKGWQVDVIDFNANRNFNDWNKFNHLLQEVDFIGITGIITQFKEVEKTVELCKNRKKADIIIGGPIASSIDELLLNWTEIKICVHGEGEETIKDLLDWKSNSNKTIDLTNIKGISFKNDSGEIIKTEARPVIEDLKQIKIPAYDLFPVDVYLNNPIGPQNPNKWVDGKNSNIEKSMNILGTRGCPYNCIYCYHNFMGQGYRKRDVEDIINEIKFLISKYDVKFIQITDDAFGCDRKLLQDFCKEVKKLNINWFCAGRPNIIDEETIKMMKESGSLGMGYGFESGSPTILKIMNKKTTLKQYEKAVKLNRKYFDFEDYTFIIGTPGETDETVQESIDFCKKVDIVPTAVFFMTPYPGTPLFNNLVKQGKLNNDPLSEVFLNYVKSLGEQGEQMIMNLTDYPDEKIYEWHDKFLKETGAWNKMKHNKGDRK